MPRDRGEPPPPSALDEALSRVSLESSPWVKRRIKKLRISGTLLTTWRPPVVDTRHVGRPGGMRFG
jgi:hypothetical protein